MGYTTFLFILITIAFLITARRLIYGVYLLIAALPFLEMFTLKTFGVTLKMSDFIAVVCLSIFVLNYLSRPRRNLLSMPLAKPLAVFVVVNIIIFLIKYPSVMNLGTEGGLNSPALRSIKVTLWCIYSVLIAIMVSYAIQDKKMLRNCILVFLGITLLVCIYSWIGLSGYLLGIKAITWRLVGRAGGFVGMKGTFDEPSYFAHYMALVLPVALMIFLFRVYRLGLFISILGSFILFVTNFFILSTAGMIGTILTLLLIPCFIHHFGLLGVREKARIFTISVIAVFILIILANIANINLFEIIKLNFLKVFKYPTARTAGRDLGFEMLREHFLVGIGPGNWAVYYWELVPESVKHRAWGPSFNNLYLEILLDVGLIGFISFAWIFVTLFRKLAAAIRKTKDRLLQAVLVGFMVGFIALLVEYYACFNFYRIYVWVPLGMAMAAIRLAHEEEKS